ncbi:helix-turn-helix domain-containing protein [Aquimarina hainanensis]|uniref:Helix-turn-helix domain-containing protein n=1 Tax=Aquimarina hainanensis TaxID=1578017 RepID=A0ABW5N6W9_9FLAO
MKGKFIVFDTKTFYKLVDEVVARIQTKAPHPEIETGPKSDWISASEAKELLGIKSNGKLLYLRKERHISVSKHGRTVLYSKKSILAFLDKSQV